MIGFLASGVSPRHAGARTLRLDGRTRQQKPLKEIEKT
jgi:hypothetical protein